MYLTVLVTGMSFAYYNKKRITAQFIYEQVLKMISALELNIVVAIIDTANPGHQYKGYNSCKKLQIEKLEIHLVHYMISLEHIT